MTRLGESLRALSLLAMVSACHSTDAASSTDGGSPVDASVDAEEGAPETPFTADAMRAAAILYDTKYCTAFQKCDPDNFLHSYGTLEKCVSADATVADLATFFGPGTTLTPESLTTCANAVDFSTCESWVKYIFEDDVPDACRATAYGTLPNGSSCAPTTTGSIPYWNQCESSICETALIGSCGTCVAAIGLGQTCEQTYACAPETQCAGSPTPICKPFGELGDPCDPVNTPCQIYLACKAGTCANISPDDACDPSFGCTFPYYRTCNPDTRKCESAIKNLGEHCGVVANGEYFSCAAGSACKRDADPSDGGVDGSDDGGDGAALATYTCVPILEDGAPCDVLEYPFYDPCRRDLLHTSACSGSVCKRLGPLECAPPVPPP